MRTTWEPCHTMPLIRQSKSQCNREVRPDQWEKAGVREKTPRWNWRFEAACPHCERRGCQRRDIARGNQIARDLAERSLYSKGKTGNFAPLLNVAAGRGAKGNMDNIGPHWLESQTLPLASGAHGILEEDFFVFIDFIYLFLERGAGRQKNINLQLPLACLLLGTWPATQACVLTGNWTCDPLVHRLVLKPLSCTSRGTPTGFYSQKLWGFILQALEPWAVQSGLGLGSLVPKVPLPVFIHHTWMWACPFHHFCCLSAPTPHPCPSSSSRWMWLL